MKRTAENFKKLYFDEGLTLSQIGDCLGCISAVRVKELMNALGINRRKRGPRHGSRYTTLVGYIQHIKESNKINRKKLKSFLIHNDSVCDNCGRMGSDLKGGLVPYYVASIKTKDDIKIYCVECRKLVKLLSFPRNISIMKMVKNTPIADIALKHDLKKVSVYNIIRKMNNTKKRFDQLGMK